MQKALKHVPDGDYILAGVNVVVESNDIYLICTHKIHYGVIDASVKKEQGWYVSFQRLGRIRRGEVKVKRDKGLLLPA